MITDCNYKPSADRLTRELTDSMADPSALNMLRIPSGILIALDWRPFHFALQPFHHLVRLVHIVAMAAFYGAICLLDLRLMGWNDTIPLRPLALRLLPLLYGLFGMAVATGTLLFFYDPVKVGSHAYFTLKLVLIVLGLANAGVFHRAGYGLALSAQVMPHHARLAGALSLAFWTAVIVCACLNVEAAPKMLLR